MCEACIRPGHRVNLQNPGSVRWNILLSSEYQSRPLHEWWEADRMGQRDDVAGAVKIYLGRLIWIRKNSGELIAHRPQ
ncbi:hypothetical protein GCM10022223_03040 [Kineosporia mesophila]|uniref:Uncharacterized protein n=1 Tax=Kineosporia mesophila TaxID=566012 RepID=A0ABP6YX75_9ACTN